MVAKYFFPDVHKKEIAQIAEAEPKYVVWPFPFWKWILDKGVKINEFSSIDYTAWAVQGVAGLRKSVSEKEFKYYAENTKNLSAYAECIREVFSHPNFHFHWQRPTFTDLQKAFERGAVCEVLVDSHTLDEVKGFELHRLVVLDVQMDNVVVHDPRVRPMERHIKRNVPKALFIKAWLEAVSNPELCTYEKEKAR
ncbi:MAG: hypothetical protein HY393_01815 [Candidatus Diapherotrites archaeon]|nr:hypothetical protein [Candidatus Diapherotrites archaeon]